nr:fibulin-1-like [Nerophis lumbriciformis]
MIYILFKHVLNVSKTEPVKNKKKVMTSRSSPLPTTSRQAGFVLACGAPWSRHAAARICGTTPCVMSPWILFVFNICAVLHANAFLATTPSTNTQMLHRCCENGKQKALSIQTCTDLPYIANSHMCRIAQEQCCVGVLEQQQCSKGTTMARQQWACEHYFFQGDSWQTRISKMCCDCCMFGILSARHDPGCGMPYVSMGKQCRDAAKSCCANNATEEISPTAEVPVNITTPLPMGASNCTVSNCSQDCIDSVTCACNAGYRLQYDGVTCKDINECLMDMHNCVLGQVCINTEGSFRCQRETSCGTGYELTDSNNCKDIDECALATHNCGSEFECANTQGSFRCYPREKCPAGFIQDAVGNCIDIDECMVLVNPCHPGHTCVNTPGSHRCQRTTVTCGRGYHLSADGTHCEDVDECQTGSVCRDHSCTNMMGTYRCHCRGGFMFNSVSRQCEDINECRHYPGRLCAHNCDNTEGSYQCSCSNGFQLTHDGSSCDDINECVNSPCSQECANVYGSYQCYCRRGYQLSDIDGNTCEDIDECALPTGDQVCSYHCSNVPGSFYCTCPPTGYTLATNGHTCQDIDECAARIHTCSASQTCYNIHGAYRCLSFVCPSYYQQATHGARNPSSMQCVKSCPFNDDICKRDPVRLITYSIFSLPTYRHLSQPEDVIFLRTTSSTSDTGAYVIFDILKADDQDSFDVVRRSHQGFIMGVVRLVKPVIGPTDIELHVAISYIKSGLVSHRNVAVVHVCITEFWF